MGIKFCKKCNKKLDVSLFRWISSKQEYFSRCKRCEREYRRKKDYERYHNDPKRKEFVNESGKKRVKEKGRGGIYKKTQYRATKTGFYNKPCPFCGAMGNIVTHHLDYSKWYEVVFCCKQCHMAIHRGEIKDFNIVNLLNFTK